MSYKTLSTSLKWEVLNWEKIMTGVTSMEFPDPALLERSFRDLSTCKFRPPNLAMHRDLNYLAKLSRTRNAPSIWTSHEIVRVFNSCALIGYLNPEFLSQLGREILSRTLSSDLDHIQLSIMVRALGQLGQIAIKTDCLHPCGIFFGISEVIVQILEEILKQERCVSFTEEHLTEIWNGVAKLRYYDPKMLKELAIETSKPHRLMYTSFGRSFCEFVCDFESRQFTESEISTLILSTALLKFRDRLFRNALLEECIQSHRLLAYSPEDLSKIYSGLGLLELRCEKTLSALDVEMVKLHHLTEFKAPELAMIVISYGVLHWFNPSSIVKLTEELTKLTRRKELKQKGFQELVKALSNFTAKGDYNSSKKLILECAKQPISSSFYKAF